MIKMYMDVPSMIALMIMTAIMERAEIRGRKLTYKETKIFFILEIIVDINLISLGTITEPSLYSFANIVLSVVYGIMCYATYKQLGELKNDMNQCDKEVTDIKEKDNK